MIRSVLRNIRVRFEHYNPGELTREQVRRVVRLYCLLYPDVCRNLEIEQRAEKLQSCAHAIFAHSSDNAIAGFVFFYCNSDAQVGFITSIGRLSSAEIGVGTSLHMQYQEFVTSQGMRSSCLEVDKTNSRALSFYRKLGYSVYDEKGDLLLMKKEIQEDSI